jgi:hypothetical protein
LSVFAGSILSVLEVAGTLLLTLLVLGAEVLSDGLEEVRGDPQLGADKGENAGDDTAATTVVLGSLGVLVCRSRNHVSSKRPPVI